MCDLTDYKRLGIALVRSRSGLPVIERKRSLTEAEELTPATKILADCGALSTAKTMKSSTLCDYGTNPAIPCILQPFTASKNW